MTHFSKNNFQAWVIMSKISFWFSILLLIEPQNAWISFIFVFSVKAIGFFFKKLLSLLITSKMFSKNIFLHLHQYPCCHSCNRFQWIICCCTVQSCFYQIINLPYIFIRVSTHGPLIGPCVKWGGWALAQTLNYRRKNVKFSGDWGWAFTWAWALTRSTVYEDNLYIIHSVLQGFLLYGPPGTGKTMLAKAAADACKMRVFTPNISQLVSKWVGESGKIIRVLFKMVSGGHSPMSSVNHFIPNL